MSVGPRLGGEVFNLPVGGVGQASEHIAQVGVRINASAAAGFDECVE